jgi:hypothetical protein
MKPWTVATLILCACTSAKKVNGPDGEPGWYAIKCEDDRSNCLEKAGETCPKGYQTAEDVAGPSVYGVRNSVSFRMLVKCREGTAP